MQKFRDLALTDAVFHNSPGQQTAEDPGNCSNDQSPWQRSAPPGDETVRGPRARVDRSGRVLALPQARHQERCKYMGIIM